MKVKELSKYKNNAVLNTDSYDKRRFESIMDMSKGLKRLKKESEFPGFQPLLNDIWASLYKTKPMIKDEVAEELNTNKAFMEKIMDDETFEDNRSFTKLDELSSAVGTVKFGEKTIEWIGEQRAENERMDELMKKIEEMNKNKKENKGNKDAKKELQDAQSELGKELQNAIQNDTGSFSKAMAQAVSDTKDIKSNVKSLLSGGSGSGDAELKKVPLREQLELAESLSAHPKLKEIADWAGRFKSIARKKQKSKQAEAIDRNGITIGNSIEHLLPVELAMYMNPKTKLDFMRRFVEGETMQYEQKGKEVLGKGPIVLCLDQSGSMKNLDMQSKGFTLALMSIAKRQRRDFCLILFSTRTEIRKYPKGKINSSDMIQLATRFLGGGTDFLMPLRDSLKVIKESRFQKADIVFVTDGESRISDSFMLEYNKVKKEKGFNVLSLVIGSKINGVQSFSDKIVNIKDFTDEGSFSAFEI